MKKYIFEDWFIHMNPADRLKSIFDIYHSKYSDQNGRRAFVLLWFQIILVLSLFSITIMVLIIDIGTYRVFYTSLVIILLLIQIIALRTNFSGSYTISSWLTVISLSLAPWASAVIDDKVVSGDIIPLIYIALSIQLCAIFLSERMTLIFTFIQLIFLITFIFYNPILMKNNLPSLFTFLALVSIFGILSSFISRKQIDRIANQNIKLQENEEQLRLMIIRDPMTGLYNRLYINEIERSNVIGTRFAVFMFDIDKLKYVNDNFGHLEGDKLIISAAAILKDSFRETDIVARIGGDEFLAIVSDCDSTMAEMFIDIINKTIADNNMNTSTPRLRISISVGFSIIKNDDDTMEILMQKADELMYADKTRKRSITDN